MAVWHLRICVRVHQCLGATAWRNRSINRKIHSSYVLSPGDDITVSLCVWPWASRLRTKCQEICRHTWVCYGLSGTDTHTRTHTFPSSLRHTLQSVMSWNTTVFDVTVTAGHTCSQLFLLTLTGTGNNKKPGFGFKFRPSLLLEFVICTLCCLLKNTQMSQMLQRYKKVLFFLYE